ncbi:class B sortase [Clostridium gasigenes]|uniref:class B sortase n=1 Tax=Clostridium gasigenes TaxID=94869 RepID=UPI001C0C96B4|nr:class B sortase [Clostridium gasigenes]MBU3109139.1 class B sortase [Clostridium gasigenes]
MKKFVFVILILLLTSIFVFSIYKIFYTSYDNKKASFVYEEVKKDNEEKVNLQETNKNYKFWLTIPNTQIDYPVVQGIDNDFYLNHDFYKNPSLSGTLFLDYRNTVNIDKNIIIYGHNMKNGSMFNNLVYYKNPTFFNNNKKISLTINDITFEYDVFQVVIAKEDNVYLNGSITSFEEFKSYLNTNGLYDVDFNISDKDNFLTLSSCSYEYAGARILVFAKRI